MYFRPLEDNVGSRKYKLEARDKDGATSSDTVTLYVEKESAPINHQLSVNFRIAKKYRESYATGLDWQLDLMNRVARFYGDGSTSALQALHVGANTFTWRNTSLPYFLCPLKDISHLYQVNTMPALPNGLWLIIF